ncbi:borneol dehydrogenase, mitochondrial-like isoform X2 [Silene latifolia]|uniref:borneol dehydrogenase, mitochondrial-like isoform X2 n=1 Tax=Silene latifolia TaxID=37657 RepID=UPI003D771346
MEVQDDLGKICKELGPSATFIQCDVTKEEDVKNVVDYPISQYGKLDIMHNNAGGLLTPSIIETTLSEFEEVMKVNLIGSFLGTKHAARVMIPTKQGSIITTSSTSSIIGGGAIYSYTSSKHGVVGLMKNAAVELGNYGIRVNCVAPYLTSTPMARSFLNIKDEDFSNFYSNIKGERCKVEDIANAALFLASDDAKYVSGHNLVVDGGFTIMNPGFCIYEYTK